MMKKTFSMVSLVLLAGCIFSIYEFSATELIESSLSQFDSPWEWSSIPVKLPSSSVGLAFEDAFVDASEGRLIKQFDDQPGYNRISMSVLTFKDLASMRKFRDSSVADLRAGGLGLTEKNPEFEDLECEGFVKVLEQGQQKNLICWERTTFVALESYSIDGNFENIEQIMLDSWEQIRENT